SHIWDKWRMVAVVLTLGLGGCGASPSAEQNQAKSTRPDVAVTSNLLCDLTRQIAQDTVSLNCLMPPELDPHVFQATPSDRKAIEQADLVLYVGYGYEPELIRIIQATNTPAPKVAVAEQAVPDPILGAAHEHEADHAELDHAEADHAEPDHAHDDTATTQGLTPDPHVWQDPQQGIRLAEVIRDQLKQIAPANAAVYDQNAEKLTTDLAEINTWMKQQIATVPATDRKLVTTHDSFRYFAKAYGFEVGGTIAGLSTDERPSATHLAELVEMVKRENVPAIFAEKTTNPQWMETLSKDANVQVADRPLSVESPTGEGTDIPDYQAMLTTNTCTIVNALGGKCAIETAPGSTP
ncbi:MAG TPA: metal ABC transporter substrate-binding protein, partial [Allocoleopsis sp.]